MTNLFRAFDRNRDGRIELHELEEIAEAAYVDISDLRKEFAERRLSGFVAWGPFCRMLNDDMSCLYLANKEIVEVLSEMRP